MVAASSERFLDHEPRFGTWLPMESAPKSERWILLYASNGDYEIGNWHVTQCWVSKRGYLVEPICWMPLPEPPRRRS